MIAMRRVRATTMWFGWLTLASGVAALGCGTLRNHPPDTRPPSSVDRLVAILWQGQTLYGLGPGCHAWRAEPGDPDILIEPDDADDPSADDADAPGSDEAGDATADDSGQPEDARNTEAPKAPWSFAGTLTRTGPDKIGRIYGFSYYVYTDKHPLQMRLSGRGSWSPAPGVTIEGSGGDGYAIIGSASMCTIVVEVRSPPHLPDAVRVGAETWYLTRDACLKARRGAIFDGPSHCVAGKPAGSPPAQQVP